MEQTNQNKVGKWLKNSTGAIWNSRRPDGDASPAPALELLASDSFNSGLGQLTPSHTGIIRHARTTNKPKSGTHCLRLNLKAGIDDPITGLAGHGLYTANWMPAVPQKKRMRWVFNYRLDAADWKIANNGVLMKLGYVMASNPDDLQQTFYVSGNMTPGNFLNLAGNGGTHTGWHLRDYAWKTAQGNPSLTLYLDHPNPCAADGKWHEIIFDVINNFNNLGYNKMRITVDGVRLYESNGAKNIDADGYFNMPPEQPMYGFRLGYAAPEVTSLVVDGAAGEHACGIQWDELSVSGSDE